MLRLAHHGVAPATLDDVQPVTTADDLRAAARARRRDDRERRGRSATSSRSCAGRASCRASRSARARAPPSTCSRRPRRRPGSASRDFVVPDDVVAVAPAVLRHRLQLRPEAELERYTTDDAVRTAISTVPIPAMSPDAAAPRSVARVARASSRSFVPVASRSRSCCSCSCRRSRLDTRRRAASAAARRRARARRRSRRGGSVAPARWRRRRRRDPAQRPRPAGPAARCHDRRRRPGRPTLDAALVASRPRPPRPARARRAPRGPLGLATWYVRRRGEPARGARVPRRAGGPAAGDRGAAGPLPRPGPTHARSARPRDRLRVGPRLPPRRRRPADQLARDVTPGPAHEQPVPGRAGPRHRLRARRRPAHGCAASATSRGLDAAVDAVTAVAFVADEVGDRIGLIAFDREIRRRSDDAARRCGDAVVQAILDVEPRLVDSDYDLAFRAVERRQARARHRVHRSRRRSRRRDRLLAAVPVLTRRHAVVVASVTDPDLQRAMVHAPPSAARRLRNCRRPRRAGRADARVAARLRGSGAVVLEAPPDRLGEACVGAYLRLKSRARL